MSMKALLWKDMWVNRWVLLVGAALLTMPYLALTIYALFNTWSEWWSYEPVFMVANISLFLSTVTIAMLGGYAFAAERADRSAEFLAYLPPSRLAIVASKAVFAVGVSLGLVLIHQVVIRFVAPMLPGAPAVTELVESPLIIPYTAILMFGVAWFMSSFASGPALAAGVGILAPLITPMVLFTVYRTLGLPMNNFEQHFNIISVVGGVSCFVVGAIYYIRRFAP